MRPVLTVEPLTRHNFEDAIATLADAFAAGPLMAYLFGGASSVPYDGVAAVMRFSCEVRLQLGWPLLGALRDDRLVGVLGTTLPGAADWPAALHDAHAALAQALGPAASDRLSRFSAAAHAHRPPEPHHHVGLIGVRRAEQRTGVGTALLSALHDLADADAGSVGVAANVEDARIAAWYERRGYVVQAWDDTLGDGMEVWTLFRPRGGAVEDDDEFD